jgi:hypothetical protein
MGILSKNPMDEPMHYGEVFGTWSYLVTTKGAVASFQTVLNHAGDEDLRERLEEAIKLGQEEAAKIETLLKENGVGLPPTPPDRPKANLEDIPVGARYQDYEIAAMLAASITAGLVSATAIMGQCMREDIATMFAQFNVQKALLGVKVLRMNKDKGWIYPPPLHKVGGTE